MPNLIYVATDSLWFSNSISAISSSPFALVRNTANKAGEARLTNQIAVCKIGFCTTSYYQLLGRG